MAAENIFQQYLQPVRSVADYSADMDKQEQNGLSLAALRLQNKTGQQSFADDQAYRQAAKDSAGDTNKLIQALNSMGLAKKAQEIQQFGLANAKTQADTALANAHAKNFGQTTDASAFKLEQEKRQQQASSMAALQSPDDAIAHITKQVQGGAFTPEQGQAAIQAVPKDPVEFARWQLGHLKEFLSPKERIALEIPDANNVNSGNISRLNNRDTVGATLAGQQSTAATAAAGRAQAERHFGISQDNAKGQIVQTDNGPVLVNTRTGTGRIVSGPDGQALPGISKPLNDSQSKALLFGTRMQQSDKILGQLATEGMTSSVPGSRAPLIGSMVTAMSPANSQMLDQAKRDFMTAVLRRESGASISSGEYDNADKQYFPQIGDSKEVIAQKAKNRQLAIQGVLIEVPEKQRGSITPADAALAGIPSGDAIAAEVARRAALKRSGGGAR